MVYEEIKAKIKKLKEELNAANEAVESTKKEQLNLDKQLAKINTKYDEKIATATQQAKMEEEAKVCGSLRSRLDYIQQCLEKLQENYDNKNKNFNLEFYRKKYLSEMDYVEELSDISKDVLGSIKAANGEEFTNNLKSNLEGKCLDLDINGYKQLIEKLGKLDSKKLKKKDGWNFGVAIDYCFSILNPETDCNILKTEDDVVKKNNTEQKSQNEGKQSDEKNKSDDKDKSDDKESKKIGNKKEDKPKLLNNLVIYFVMCLILVAVTFKYLAGVYILFLFSVCCYNMCNNMFLMRTFIECITVGNNVDALKSNTEDKLLKMIELDKKKLNNQYENKSEKMLKDMDKVNLELNGILSEFEQSFSYDSSDLEISRSKELKNLDITRKKLGAGLNERRSLVVQLEKKLNELNIELDKCIQGMENEYLEPAISKSLDIEEKIYYEFNPKPKYFLFPFKSTIVIYEEEEDYKSFVDLLTMRLSVSVNPECISFTLIDTTNMGKQFLYFNKNDDYFQIVSKEENLKEMMNTLYTALEKRMYIILQEKPNIKEYNKYMTEINSLTEDYQIIYIFNPPNNFYNDLEIQRLIRNGSSVGIYVFCFYSYNDYENFSEKDIEHLDLYEHFMFASQNDVKDFNIQKIIDSLKEED